MYRLFALLSFAFMFLATTVHAQAGATKTDTLLQYHTTVGTTAALAIPVINVGGQLHGWRICADSGNTNTLTLGQLANPSTDGVVLGAGACFECPGCTTPALKSLNAKGGASGQGYSVVQFR